MGDSKSNTSLTSYHKWEIVEAIVLTCVITASIFLIPSSSSFEMEEEFYVSEITGEIVLSTRTSMDALGLHEFDKGAKSSIHLGVQYIESEPCQNCEHPLQGIQINGFVNISDLIDQNDRRGRVEAKLNITYLAEEDSLGFIHKEWFKFHWDAGDLSKFYDIYLEHHPPIWGDSQRFDAAFIDNEPFKETRNGPYIGITDNQADATINGCLPEAFTCSSQSPSDINLTTFKVKNMQRSKVVFDQNWHKYESVTDEGNPIQSLDFMTSVLDVRNKEMPAEFFCPEGLNIQQQQTWQIEGTGIRQIEPLGLWLKALNLPYGTISPQDGLWSEVESSGGDCGSLIDSYGRPQFSIYVPS
tara:strand:- start:15 stop:1082 length:1068 start_codon:yes stop_codon:yes gene_type:complete